jgi:hypothetical protein
MFRRLEAGLEAPGSVCMFLPPPLPVTNQHAPLALADSHFRFGPQARGSSSCGIQRILWEQPMSIEVINYRPLRQATTTPRDGAARHRK